MAGEGDGTTGSTVRRQDTATPNHSGELGQDVPPEVPVEVPTSPGAFSGPQFPLDLARVLAAWDRLPEAIKAGVLALVQAAGGSSG